LQHLARPLGPADSHRDAPGAAARRSGATGLAGILLAVGLAGCFPRARQEPPAPSVARIVTTERGPRGGRLVLVDVAGARLADLTPLAHRVATIDSNPAWSADGRWIAFASNRARVGLDQTSLWLVEARRGSSLHRLTRERSVDRDPRWSPDGRHLVYASSAGVTFDLWVLDLTPGPGGRPRPVGRPRRLTRTDALDELTPSVSPDGRTVVYMGLDRQTQRSRLYLVPIAGGPSRPLTDGPADLTPSFSPDGRVIAFAAPVKGRGDTDLWAVDADGGRRRLLVGEPLADETGPVWSADGRFLFATSVLRSVASGLPILSSLAFVDLGEQRPILRALHDPAQVVARLGAALAPAPLDADRLRRHPPYQAAVRRAIREMQERERQGEAP
jgi:Tol biopolymer transport system component